MAWYFLRGRAHHLVNYLANAGHEVTVFGPRSARANGPRKPKGVRFVEPLLIPERIEQWPVVGRRVRKLNLQIRQDAQRQFCCSKNDLHIFAHRPEFRLVEKPARLIYDCMDDWEGFSNAPAGIAENEMRLCDLADEIWVVSRYLEKKLSGENRKIRYIPNAGDIEHFSRSISDTTSSSSRIKCAAYVGCIADWFDVDLLVKCAKKLPDWEFKIAGPITLDATQRARLNEVNISLVGRLPYESLPGFLADCSVGLVPFKVDNLVLATSPIKMYEYLAAGLPVVSTIMPEVQQVEREAGGFVICAQSAEEFANAIRTAATYHDRAEISRFSQRFSWKQRFSEAFQHVAESHQ